jgi:hypothetical protein
MKRKRRRWTAALTALAVLLVLVEKIMVEILVHNVGLVF